MTNCAGCGKLLHRDEPIGAAFTQEGQRTFLHRHCEEKTDQYNRWRDEAAWAYRPIHLTLTEWRHCNPRKHLGVWQSIFIARRDEDVWCPDCGLKISRHEGLKCSYCTGTVVILQAATTQMVFTHREPLYKLLLHCTERGEESNAYAIISGYTAVTVTPKKRRPDGQASPTEVMMLKYQPKGDPKQGLTV